MKRSQINNSIETAIDVFNKLGINLPPFAFWSANEWDRKGKEVDEPRKYYFCNEYPESTK